MTWLPRRPRYKPPFIVKIIEGSYHLVERVHLDHYVTCCGLRIDTAAIDDQSVTEVARQTMLRKNDFIDTFREPCQNCVHTEFWQKDWHPNVHYRILD